MITSVDAAARSRFNTVFAAHIWGGNAVGALLASTALTYAGWWGVCAVALVAAAVALHLQRRGAAADAPAR
jgi:hypothetical protein